jgi:hypothetical protein
MATIRRNARSRSSGGVAEKRRAEKSGPVAPIAGIGAIWCDEIPNLAPRQGLANSVLTLTGASTTHSVAIARACLPLVVKVMMVVVMPMPPTMVMMVMPPSPPRMKVDYWRRLHVDRRGWCDDRRRRRRNIGAG